MKHLKDKKGTIPHLFSKLIVWWCVLFGTGACFYALRIESRTDKSPAGTLGVVLAFLGGELMLLCLRTIINDAKKKNVPKSDTQEGDNT